jgi:hypothetical protein
MSINPPGYIQKWHGIEKGRSLNAAEVEYFVALIMGCIERHLDERSVGPDG